MKESAVLKFEDIHKSFGAIEVLKGINLEAYRGDVIALIGPSGSGKSTLLRCANLLEIPDRGNVIIHGEKVLMKKDRSARQYPKSRKQVERIRTSLGMVFQNFNLWTHMTILENLIEAPIHVLGKSKKEAIERAEFLLKKVGIFDKRNAYPNHLSGGQKQRAAIARALAMDPEAILFDEPTSALDPEMAIEVLGVIQSLAEEGITMLIVTHELAFARKVASKVVFLHQGKIEEEGPPKLLFEKPKSKRLKQFLESHFA